ncbi:hypothetical protein RO3G_08885 [Rhizopus delemar RA 99-880]|uniref:Uncharacterized protein n=1 Tax=Rhizopus delemar (strain RA 99-880 / ATCC MYA-4621 / FGSC 9543 / NRRL 43880) TaxID=246409 RepID=I1C6U5_RHIO9|nr:hypothetical protein RO3G_08885 [Rhizopus delemar RA 99-880]|eukprot:EIE84175.1 hypothetical protein RO3G_08885 [Rhizopus delemar RA 99-880]
MEAFLSTLPPYVHKFLDKHPATDVFNLLRELICFAVLYSEDRERIKAATDEFLVKREKEIKQEVEEQVIQEEEEEEEEETVAVVEEPKQIVADAVVPEIPVTEKPKMPNTFPQWWGHQEFQHSDRNVAAEKKLMKKKKNRLNDYQTKWLYPT